jgi:hypothetical protein
MKYRLTGNYGTFTITKVVEAENEQAAYWQTGIMETLTGAGWSVLDGPDGESWEIEEVTP